jgi:hypothetical protein
MNSYHCDSWGTGTKPLTWCRRSPIVFSWSKKILICSTLLCNLCQQFCEEMDADWCMVYDFMEAQCGKLTDAQWDEVEAVYNPFLNDSRY